MRSQQKINERFCATNSFFLPHPFPSSDDPLGRRALPIRSFDWLGHRLLLVSRKEATRRPGQLPWWELPGTRDSGRCTRCD